jgi:ribosomal protein L37AE/L43A
MFQVTYRCLNCDQTSLSPLAEMTHGDAGIWVCPHCDAVFQILVEFRQINPDEMVNPAYAERRTGKTNGK